MKIKNITSIRTNINLNENEAYILFKILGNISPAKVFEYAKL